MESFFKEKKVKLSPEGYRRQRQKLFESYDWRCAGCGKLLPLDRDHIKKRSRGGGDELSNAQPLCRKCHDEKDNIAPSKSKFRKFTAS